MGGKGSKEGSSHHLQGNAHVNILYTDSIRLTSGTSFLMAFSTRTLRVVSVMGQPAWKPRNFDLSIRAGQKT